MYNPNFVAMYSRQEASRIRQEFWTTLGQYMTPILSSEGNRINWINYKTGEQHIAFKMDADAKSASIAIVLSHPDVDIQQLYFEQFTELKTLLHSALEEEWEWEQAVDDGFGRTISRISRRLDNANIFNKADWPQMISFLKQRLIALDSFWENAKYGFEALR